MKVSELIQGLQDMQKAYGDLKVNLAIDTIEGRPIFNDDDICLSYSKFDDQDDEISIQNFLYYWYV